MVEKADWTKLKPADVEKLIIEIGKQKVPSEKIGLMLRDQHGIPKVKLFGLKINKVLAKHNLAVNSEKKHIETKIKRLKKHSEKNKHDYTAMRKAVMYASQVKKMENLAAE